MWTVDLIAKLTEGVAKLVSVAMSRKDPKAVLEYIDSQINVMEEWEQALDDRIARDFGSD